MVLFEIAEIKMPQKNWGEAIAYRIIFIVVSFQKKES